jgi:asparagine synthase (glutamine-hydrolysing)
MCGISLIVGDDPRGDLGAMVAALRHRGPDGQACRTEAGARLGHARLSVIDLHTGGQPMSDATGRYWITFNGEIYNYAELRDELKTTAVFRTHSDTEVVLAAYARWGERALDRLRGMFALAIWDAETQTLFAARDLFGEKPLYFVQPSASQFAIASEIKALAASGLIEKRLNLSTVDAYLALGYVPPTTTIYRGVRTLPPAHWLRVADGQLTIQQYWKPRFDPMSIELREAGERLRELLRQAVRRQMVADVPVGAFLSGGLDSSSIVAMMRETNGSASINTFAVGFGDVINELPYARAVARRYGTDHHEIDLGTPAVAPLLERMATVYDEPFADSSSIPTYLISEFASRHTKVVLSGDGGDEMLGGYSWYQQLALSERMHGSRLAWIALRAISRALRERNAALHKRSVAAGLATRWPDMWQRAAMNQVYMRGPRRRELWGARFEGIVPFAGPEDRPDSSVAGLDRAFFYDVATYLPGDILVKVDRAAMAHGLETRAPFLDRDLAEFTLALPASLKATARQTKIVLRAACERDWPDEVRVRGKHGFGAPYRRWLEFPDVRALTARVFRTDGRLRQLLPGISAGDPAPTFETWSLLTLGLWLDRQEVAV